MGLKYIYAKQYTSTSAGSLGTYTGNEIRLYIPYYPQYTIADMQTILSGGIVWGNKRIGVITDAGLAFANAYPELFIGSCAAVSTDTNEQIQTLYGPFPNFFADVYTSIEGTGNYMHLVNPEDNCVITIGPGSHYNGDMYLSRKAVGATTFTPETCFPFMQGAKVWDNPEFRCIVECSDGYALFAVGAFSSYADDLHIGGGALPYIQELAAVFYGTAKPVVIDPYAGGGTSGPGGGDGTFTFTSTDIPIPPLPGIGAVNTGFLTLYKPTAGELQSTAQYMWSGSFDPDNFRKLFANPMDAILGLHIVPTSGAHPAAGLSTLQIGNISTGLSMARVTEQYYELDCGTITISPKWGAYLDYSPYSKLSLYLPYVGIVPISPDDCMGGSIRVVYHVDILSGSCCVYVYCTSNRGTAGHTLYTFTGACACDCPVTEGQYTNAVLGILGIAGGVAGAISAGLTGNAGGITGGIGEAANAALSMVKPDIGRSGNFGGSAGLMGIQYPFLILTIPKMCTPGEQNTYRGYPSFMTVELGDIEGYAEVEITHLHDMSLTADEIAELKTILESGVIF